MVDQVMAENDNAALLAVLEKRLTVFRNLHTALAESESILSRALFQSHQRLDVIAEAWRAQFSVEDLVRFARLISASHATQAPTGWMLGDPRRPYPSDDQMKESILRRLPDTASAMSAQSQDRRLSLSRSLSGSLPTVAALPAGPQSSVNPLAQLAASYEQDILKFRQRPGENGTNGVNMD